MFLQIDHSTHYRFAAPVGFTPHLLRFLPRTTPGLHLLKSSLTISPQASVKWNLDALGNIVGRVIFPTESDALLIKSSILIEQYLANPFDFLLEEQALHLPISYTERELFLLSPCLQEMDQGAAATLSGWIPPFLDNHRGVNGRALTLATITAINSAIPSLFRYVPRHVHGVWTVEERFENREGTCRDFAHLLIETARFLGIPARYISGYLCSSPDGRAGESSTHGWCELYLPGAGWRGFDPTNGILAGGHHIAVASSITAGEIPPIEGTYCGDSSLCIGHEVDIAAYELLPAEVMTHS